MPYCGDVGYTRNKQRDVIKAVHWFVRDVGAFVPADLLIPNVPPEYGTETVQTRLRWHAREAMRKAVVVFLDLSDLMEVLNDGGEEPLIERLMTCTDEQLEEWLRIIEVQAIDRERGERRKP